MNKKTLTGLMVVGVVGAVLYLVAKDKKGLTKKDRELILSRLTADFGQKDYHKSFIESADVEYLKAWADSIKKGVQTFFYENKEYWVRGGSAKR